MKKPGLQDLVSQTFLEDQGCIPLLDISMLYIFKYINKHQVRDYLEAPLLTTERSRYMRLLAIYSRPFSVVGYFVR